MDNKNVIGNFGISLC